MVDTVDARSHPLCFDIVFLVQYKNFILLNWLTDNF